MQTPEYISDIELNIIGSLLLWYDELKPLMAMLVADDFSNAECREIFEIMQAHTGSTGGAFDFTRIVAKTDEKKILPVIQQALSLPSTSMHFKGSVSSLKEISANRRIKQELIRIATSSVHIDLTELQSLVDIEKGNELTLSYIDKSMLSLQAFIDGIGREKPRIRLGFPTLDKVIGGLRIPSVMMIGAYPSVGKTAFALNIADKQDNAVVLFSLEMSVEMIYERLISAKRKINYDLFSAQQFTAEQKIALNDCAESLKDRKFYVFDDVYDIEGQSAIIANIKPKLVIVDYIQKVKTSKKTDNRRAEIDYLSGMYKQLANYNQCAIILLSQISRVDRNEPKMSSLKESGSLEADGDYIGILHRPYVLRKDDPNIRPEEAYILIDKNKFGNTGKLDLHFDGRYQQFYEVDGKTAKPVREVDNRSHSSQKQIDLYEGAVPVDDDLPFL